MSTYTAERRRPQLTTVAVVAIVLKDLSERSMAALDEFFRLAATRLKGANGAF